MGARSPAGPKRGGTRHQQHRDYRITVHAADAFRERFSHLIDAVGALDGPAVYGLIARYINRARKLPVDRRVAEEMTAYSSRIRAATMDRPATYLAEADPLDDLDFAGPVFVISPSGTHVLTVLTAQYFRENCRTASRRLAERGVPVAVPDTPPTARVAPNPPPPATLAPLLAPLPKPAPTSAMPAPLAARIKTTTVVTHSVTVSLAELISAALGIPVSALEGRTAKLTHPDWQRIEPPLDCAITVEWTQE